MSFAEDFEVYKSNVTLGMLQQLSQALDVATESIEAIGIGYYPAQNCWVMPERNTVGEIIGLSCRAVEGNKKWLIKGSNRGLIYGLNQNAFKGNDRYEAGRHHWVQIYKHKELTCPICGKDDWCMVSSDNPLDPAAVMCGRTPQGAAKYIEGSGYLHIRRENKNLVKEQVLLSSELPILIVEGWSDTVVGHSLGFVTVGRPSAEGGNSLLQGMPLAGREVWILGENDSGAGKRGMDKTFLTLKEIARTVKRVLPPEGIKDLRDWCNTKKITKEDLIEYFNTCGTSNPLDDVFPDDAPMTIAEKFLQDTKTHDGVFTLKIHRGQWMEWNRNVYIEVDVPDLRGQLYRYLSDKQYAKPTNNGIEIVPFKATRNKISDIVDAASAFCTILESPPVWLDNRDKDFKRLIIFKNGMLDVNEFIEGNIILEEPTPKLFSCNALPYDFNPDIGCKEWEDTVNDIFDGDRGRIRLLKQWMGYLLLPDMSFEKFMMFIGPPRSGKGTIIESISSMLGYKNCVSTTLKSLAVDFGHQKLMGKLAAFLPDVKAPHISQTPYLIERILQITGGDPVSVNRKFKDEIPWVHLICRFTLAVNEIPELPDYTSALTARLLALQFSKSYLGNEDIHLKDRLKKAAAEGKIINFALEGLKDLLTEKRFTIPESSRDVERSFREVNNPIWSFIYECCNMGGYTSCQMLYDAWSHWCLETGIKPGTRIMFGKRLKNTIPAIKTIRRSLETGDTDRLYAYEGYSLKKWVRDALGEP